MHGLALARIPSVKLLALFFCMFIAIKITLIKVYNGEGRISTGEMH